MLLLPAFGEDDLEALFVPGSPGWLTAGCSRALSSCPCTASPAAAPGWALQARAGKRGKGALIANWICFSVKWSGFQGWSCSSLGAGHWSVLKLL